MTIPAALRDERGQGVRTIEVDQERVALVTWEFQVFASGQWTLTQRHRELVPRSLSCPPSRSALDDSLDLPAYSAHIYRRCDVYEPPFV